VGFLGKFISTLGILRRALKMAVSGLDIPFFIVLGGGAMSMGRPFMFLSRSSVYIVHISLFRKIPSLSLARTSPARGTPQDLGLHVLTFTIRTKCSNTQLDIC
jgi:hypothetical protein